MRNPPKIPASIRRRIERLEAQNAALRDSQERAWRGYSKVLGDFVEYRMRCEQAIRILNGTDYEDNEIDGGNK